MMQFKFQKDNTFEVRKAMSARMKAEHPDHVVIIIEKEPSSPIKDVDKHKYLVPEHVTLLQLVWIIRKSINLHHEQSLFILCNHSAPPMSMSMIELHKNHVHEDGFVYLSYSGEHTFGINSN